MLNLVIVFCMACLASSVILWRLLHTGWAWHLATDVPNHRSLHARPTPRVGGWGIIPVAIVSMLWASHSNWSLALCTAFLALLSYIDDRKGVTAWMRLSAHFLAVIGFLYFSGTSLEVSLPVWTLLPLIVGMVWLINLYNFMDGSDGLAGGMSLFGFGAYAVAAALDEQVALAYTAMSISGAALGFLFFNFHPAKLFLGDAGAIPLGFLAGALGFVGWRCAAWPAWFPVWVFAPFILDASMTVFKRMLRRERIWEAHCDHYYQRMVRSGLGHKWTAIVWYIFMLAAAVSGILFL